MSRRAFCLGLALLLSSSIVQAAGPVVFSCDGADLVQARERYQAKEPATGKAVDGIRKQAEELLGMAPMSVMEKTPTAPSGDKHDYMSLSPYWWPDPKKSDGLPYVRKDGQFNPERANYDEERFDKVTSAAATLALAYYFTGDERFAAKAHDLIKVWYFDPESRMNPNCQFAQFVPGYTETRASGVIEARKTINVLDAAGLLAGSQHWSTDDDAKMKSWVKEMLAYLLDSKQGKSEQKSPNNHGTWYGVQVATYALYLGDEAQAKKLLTKYVRDRVKTQVEPDGRQPLELERTRGFDYSRFNILAHEDAAMLADRVGLDLWNYKSDDGRSIRAALDWLLPYATGEKKWEHQQIAASKMKECATVYRRAARAYNEPKYEEAIRHMPGIDGAGELTNLMFPATSAAKP